MNPRRIIIVGPSGGGKTALAEALARELGIPVISMDEYRVRSNRTPIMTEVAGRKVRNYEHPHYWDSNSVACKLRACIQAGAGFIAEGNHLLTYPAIAALAADESNGIELYYLDVPFAVSLERRTHRNRGTLADQAFAIIGEQETAKWVTPQKAIPGVRVLDGTALTTDTTATILQPELSQTNIP